MEGLTIIVGVGVILLAAVGLWALVDAFLIPGMIRESKDSLRKPLAMDAMLAKGSAQSQWSGAPAALPVE
ncbi:hypothetical protein [Xanthobacter agilis]|uniref:hypothetical protein n=1 Tax=Xanthobacter agilis TaxID=47492 RepID=UPI003729C9E8